MINDDIANVIIMERSNVENSMHLVEHILVRILLDDCDDVPLLYDKPDFIVVCLSLGHGVGYLCVDETCSIF